MHNKGQFYPMLLLNAEPQSCFLEYMDTLINCDHHYLISKASDTCVVYLFWQAIESRFFMDQALQGIFQE